MQKAISQSFLIHLFIVIVFLVLTYMDKNKTIELYNFDLVESEIVKIKKVKPNIVINADKKKAVAKPVKKTRKVFGVKRKTLTSDKGQVIAKVGNTVAKKEDEKVLRDDEADSLPEPADEFLITSMPRAIKEIRPVYPKWAKEQKITGSVIFEILIDKSGKVRKATLVKGLEPRLDKSALEAILKFQFKPAYIEKEATAVRIKYAIKFILES